MTKCYRFVALAALVAAFAVLAAVPAQAGTKLVPKVDGFVFFLDQSGSMGQIHTEAGQKKMTMAKALMLAMNEKIPALGYEAGLDTFAPFGELLRGSYDASAMAGAVEGVNEDIALYGNLTPMGDGLDGLRPVLDGMPGKVAVIVFSDGRSNLGTDPVEQAKNLYRDYDNRVCFHVVSLADDGPGQETLDQIAALFSCSVAASGPALLEDSAALDTFVKDVFYDTVVTKDPKPAPAPAPAKEEVVDVIQLRVHFDFDSAKIRDDMKPILDEAAGLLKDADRPALLEGHTCNIGPEAYNQGLSERRAKSVKDYLVAKGIPAVRLGTSGLGESAPKYDNTTLEGRKLNRRVEIIIK